MKIKKSKQILSILFVLSVFLILTTSTKIEALTTTVVINEVQTSGIETGTSSQEFIELKNLSNAPIDLSNWYIEYSNSSGNISVIYNFPNNSTIHPGGYLLGTCKDTEVAFLSEYTPKFSYVMSNSCLANSGVGVILKNSLGAVIDSVYWVSSSTSISNDIVPGLAGGKSIGRKLINNQTIYSGNNKQDFEVGSPDPNVLNIGDVTEPTPTPEPTVTPTPTPEPIIEPTPEVIPEPTIEPTPSPAENSPELPILLSELFIDPDSPLTDASDEYLELFNPNNEPVNLKDYTVFTGASFTYRYTFTTDVIIEQNGYISITSGESNLSLANSGGAAKIVGPSGQLFSQTTYLPAEVGVSWAKDNNGNWVWTTTPTKDAPNIVTSLPVALKKAASSVQKSTKASVTAKPKATAAAKSTAKKSTTKVLSATDSPDLVNAPTPIPFWVLAPIGVLAVLYACYEYRYEINNKIYQFRQYRANSRTNRP